MMGMMISTMRSPTEQGAEDQKGIVGAGTEYLIISLISTRLLHHFSSSWGLRSLLLILES